MITVYSKEKCKQCEFTKQLLDNNNIAYTTVDVEQDENGMAYIKSLGYSSLPVVVTDTEHWAGFQPDKLDNYIETGKK